MKKNVIIVLLVSIIMLSGCSGRINNNSDNSNAQGNTFQITDLGICSNENTSLPVNARVPWDLIVVDGKIFVGTGDFDFNSGPTSIWTYDDATAKWTSSASVDQEAIARFVNLNGQTIALGTDPIGDPEYANCYALESGTWQTFSSVKALHVFDAEAHNGSIYYGLGCKNNASVIVKQDLTTGTYIDIQLYKNGVDVIAALEKTSNVKNKRVYDLFSVNGRLFCAFSCSYSTGKTTIEFFELKDDKFEFCQAFKNANLKMNKIVKNQVLFNSDATYKNSCYLSLGDLYKTENFIQFDKIDVPNNACVTDMYVEKGNGQETLYVLATVKDSEGFKNVIFTLVDDKLTELFSFNYSASALSFAKCDNVFYVGLGDAESENADNGRILKIEHCAE
ncbi:MAG: hypothetical protein IKK55_02590 [Clostridia bacterium]|nr:hypothetical protein [Clostridia bacterium]MBR6741146.1 hypothetical protein [Clostridia bacterium]